jgi:hypothetical protein
MVRRPPCPIAPRPPPRAGTARRYRSVKAHGTAVGLPSDADMGNSEVRGGQGAGAAGAAGAALAEATAAVTPP